MYKKLAVTVFLILSLALSFYLTSVAVARSEEDMGAQIRELQGTIEELEYALEHNPDSEKAEKWKVSLKKSKQKLEQLMPEFREYTKSKKSERKFPELEIAIDHTREQIKELIQEAAALKEEGAEPEKLKELEDKIDKKERELEKLLAHLEKRRADTRRKKELDEKEAQIHRLKGTIKELEYALEHHPDSEEVGEWEASLKESRQKLERFMAEFRKIRKPKGRFPELEMAIDRTRGQLEELRHAAKALKEKGEKPDKLEELQKKIARKERELVMLTGRMRREKAEVERGKAKVHPELVIVSLEHAHAPNLAEIIEEFLTEYGIIVADPDTHSLVIKDLPAGLEDAEKIIRALDVPRRRIVRERGRLRIYREDRERADRDRAEREDRERANRDRAERVNFFIGKVLEAGAEALTMKTREGRKVTLFVPLRKKEDGTWTQYEELSQVVASLDVESTVKVLWRRAEDKLWIRRVTRVER